MTRVMTSLAAAMLSLAALPALACPDRVPAGLAATTVGEDLLVGDVPMSVLYVTANAAAGPMLDKVEKDWIERGFAVKRSSVDDWQIVSALSERCLATLQLDDGKPATGLLAVSPLGKTTVVRKTSQPPLPPGTSVHSRVRSNDDGRPGTTIVASAPRGVTDVRDYYVRSLRAEGWNGVSAARTLAGDGSGSGSADSILVSAQRGKEQIEVMLWRGRGTQIVITVGTPP